MTDNDIRIELQSLFRLIEGNLITAANEVFRLSGYQFSEAWRAVDEAIDKVRAASAFLS